MRKYFLLTLLLAGSVLGYKRPDPRSVPRKVTEKPVETVGGNSQGSAEQAAVKEAPPAPTTTEGVERQQAAAARATKDIADIVPPKTEPAKAPSGTASPGAKPEQPRAVDPAPGIRPAAQTGKDQARSSEPSPPSPSPRTEPRKSEQPAPQAPESPASRPQPAPVTPEPESSGGFSRHYERFVETNIEVFERISELLAEKAAPYLAAVRASKIASSIVIGFVYTLLILKLATLIFPRRAGGAELDQKLLQQHFERVDGQFRDFSAGRSEGDKKLDAILKRLGELQGAVDTIKSDNKADDELLDFLGKNIEDVWKEIGTIKSKMNDNENSSNLDSFNARFETKPPAKPDREATPDELDFEAEARLEFGKPPADPEPLAPAPARPLGKAPAKRPQPVPRSHGSPMKAPHPAHEVAEAPVLEGRAGEGVQEEGPEKPKDSPPKSQPGQPLEGEADRNPPAPEPTRAQEEEQPPSLPKPPANIFNRNKILAKTRANPPAQPLGQTARSLPPEPPGQAEALPERIEDITPAPDMLLSTFNPPTTADELRPDPFSESKKMELTDDQPPLERPPLLTSRLPVRPNPMLKPAMKPIQMVKPLPRPQNPADQGKAGEKGSFI